MVQPLSVQLPAMAVQTIRTRSDTMIFWLRLGRQDLALRSAMRRIVRSVELMRRECDNVVMYSGCRQGALVLGAEVFRVE
ncbi:hypothetical protein DN402_01330 [Streptomyces sp. SW4]|nr:hypothetical protein DN402_01330 [Streptomyces sp. SW4]